MQEEVRSLFATVYKLPSLIWFSTFLANVLIIIIFRCLLQNLTLNVQNFNDLLVLSLGTGQQVTGYDAKQIAKWGARDWLINKGDSPLVDMVYYGSADMVDYNLSTIFNLQNCGTNYLRIQV
jgi:hypothetical protein